MGSSEYNSAYGTSSLPYLSSDSESSGETKQLMERKMHKKKEDKCLKDKKEKVRRKAFRIGRQSSKPGSGVKAPTQDGDWTHCVQHGRTSKPPVVHF